ncbi:hypothetical protein [Brucella endophytica]|uniref:hypothetical protein n=1 Tax=Brucella endophytica TaxID=1963359 RepID=UPI0016647F9B|nr:hypothetical protein [Brucella endophytica]
MVNAVQEILVPAIYAGRRHERRESHTDYEGTTLRDHLGIARPVSVELASERS